jgi:hypothetical protein
MARTTAGSWTVAITQPAATAGTDQDIEIKHAAHQHGL